MAGHRIFSMPYASIHKTYLNKAERKGRTSAEVDEVVRWLTGYSQVQLESHLARGTDVEGFFGGATMNPDRLLITGKVCGVQVEAVEDPLMRDIRYLDKLVDELAKGRPMTKILRTA